MSTTNPQADHGQTDDHLHQHQRRAFRIHARLFTAVMVVIVAVNVATNAAAGLLGEVSAWWSIWAFLGWGAGVTVHGTVVRMARPEGPAPA